MNKKLLFIGIMIICTMMSSCQKELLYSCNNDIDLSVKANLNNIATMTSFDWREMSDAESQKAVYRAFRPEQRLSLWEDKFQKALTLDWNDNERIHIQKFLDFLKNNCELFSGKIKLTNEMEVFLYRWSEYALENLRWKPSDVYALCMTPELMNNDKKIAIKTSSNRIVKTRSEPGGGGIKVCNCSKMSAAQIAGECSIYTNNYCSLYYDCQETTLGCGYLWLNNCEGLCVLR